MTITVRVQSCCDRLRGPLVLGDLGMRSDILWLTSGFSSHAAEVKHENSLKM